MIGRRTAAGAVFFSALLMAGAAAAAEIRECRAAVEAEARRLGLSLDPPANVQQGRNFFSTEGGGYAGWSTFIYPGTCRGAIVIETSRGCDVERSYAMGDCSLPRGR